MHWSHGCAGKPDGRVFCWGTDTYGLEVLPGMATVLTPSELAGFRFDQFVMGGHHYCAVQQAQRGWYCWGWNAAGQLGTGDTITRDHPTTPLCGAAL